MNASVSRRQEVCEAGLSNDSGYALAVPRKGPSRWARPLATFVLFFVIMWLFDSTVMLATAYKEPVGLPKFLYDWLVAPVLDPKPFDDYDFTSSWWSVLIEMGLSALQLPALALAVRIVDRKPLRSIASLSGRLRRPLLVRCAVVALALNASVIMDILSIPLSGEAPLSPGAAGAAALLVLLVPLQCAAEEFLFRGYLLQAFGSWTRSTHAAIVLQAVLFALRHDYPLIDKLGILAFGLLVGYLAARTGGLEAGIVVHTATNLPSMLQSCLLSAAFSTAELSEMVLDTGESLALDLFSNAYTVVPEIVCCMAILWLASRLGWLDESDTRTDGSWIHAD